MYNKIILDSNAQALLKEVLGEPTLEAVDVTPTTEAQTITPDDGKAFNQVNVSAVDSSIDSNITPDNIKKDVNILGVVGTLE